MSSGVSIVILCEDEQHGFFARHFLQRKGWDSKNLRVEKGTKGKGSGEQFVRENLPLELNRLRQFRGEARALVVVADADNHSVDDRIDMLRQECTKQGVEPWNSDEPVFFLIPRWEVQNWLAYLGGDQTVDESRGGYATNKFASEWRPEVRKLVEMCGRGKLDGKPPDSLNRACGEYKRFHKMVRK